MKEYNAVAACSENKKGGGVALSFQESLSYVVRGDLDIFNGNIEAIFIEIDKWKWNLAKNIIIGVIYRPPNTDLEIFVEYLSIILDKIDHEKIFYIMGDYNINLLTFDVHPNTDLFLDTLYCKSFVPLITPNSIHRK